MKTATIAQSSHSEVSTKAKSIRIEVSTGAKSIRSDVSAETLWALREGHEWAYIEVYARYAVPIRDFLSRILSNDHDAEEITHDIFAALWSERASIEPERGIIGLLFLRAKRLSLNYLAHKKVRRRYEEFCARTDWGASLAPDGELISRETQIIIELTISGMSKRKQAIWKLSNEQGLSPDEIALHLNISPSTVRNNIGEIKRSLRKVLITV